jgi:glycosyltransferase involved in cell wall biosynthesis
MIIGMMRIKDEARWIEKVLRSMLPACERILIMDDHSSDGTPDICSQFPQVTIYPSPFTGLDETRDKNWLLARIEENAAAGDTVVAIDGDEEIAPSGCAEIRRLAEAAGPWSYRFQVLYLWDRIDQIRMDGIYSRFRRPSMFRLAPGTRFRSEAGGGFHCGNVPGAPPMSECGVRLLHYGYLHREDRLRKFEWYTAADKQPIPENEDGYRHMVIGDLFPANSRTRYGGPLELMPL